MRKIGKVKYNGKSTADLGVIVSGEAAFDAAAPDYTSYQIPGKNGDLMLSNNRYLNIDVTYPAFIPADFEEKVQAIRSWMRSARSYARIEDNYDLLHFRMGMGKDVLTFEPSAENVGSNMSLVFDCKPQRFLYSGEDEVTIGTWGATESASGDVLTFDADGNVVFKTFTAQIEPQQYLNGYDRPWPAGGGPEGAPESNICPISGWNGITVRRSGKNLLPYPYSDGTFKKSGGITFKVGDDGSVTVNGTATANAVFQLTANATGALRFLREGSYFVSGVPAGASASTYNLQCRVNGAWQEVYAAGRTISYNPAAGGVDTIRIRVVSGATLDNLTFRPMLQFSPATSAHYEPYQGGQQSISWQTEAGTVYGGEIDVAGGELTVTHAAVDLGTVPWTKLEGSYPGLYYTDSLRSQIGATDPLTIHGLCSAYQMVINDGHDGGYGTAREQPDFTMRFKSSDGRVYVTNSLIADADAFTASVSGVTLVYELATPQTYQLTGEVIQAQNGLNNIWADVGPISGEYGENPNGIYNPTLFDALPLIRVKSPRNGCAVTVNGTTMTCTRRNTGTVIIDCELMNVYSGATNLNADWSKDFPVLSPGENSVTFSGADAVTIIPRWWEL